jgi:hypothetical protein
MSRLAARRFQAVRDGPGEHGAHIMENSSVAARRSPVASSV